MLRTIFTKTLYEKRWVLFFWCLGIMFTTWLTMILYPSFSQTNGLDQVIQNLPKQLQNIIGNAANLKTVGGFANSEIFALRLPLLTIIMSISLFVNVTVAEEDRGTLQTLLTLPVSRARVLTEKFLAVLLLLAVASLAGWVGIELGLLSIHTAFSAGSMLLGTLYCWLMTIAFGSVAFFLAAVTGRKGLTTGVASLFAVACFFISSFSDSVDALKPIAKYTFFHLYAQTNVVVSGLNARNTGIFIVISLILAVVGVIVFTRRDLRG